MKSMLNAPSRMGKVDRFLYSTMDDYFCRQLLLVLLSFENTIFHNNSFEDKALFLYLQVKDKGRVLYQDK